MLYFMRHSMKSIVMWFIIAAFLGTIFYAWGMKSTGGGDGGQNWIATVEGEDITPAEFENELRQMEAQLRDLPPSLLKQLNLKEQVLNNLINQRILLGKAEEMGIQVTDQEIAASIQASPFFQENGAFSSQAYRTVLAQSRMTPSVFEKRQREALLIQKLQDLIQDSTKVTDEEIQEDYLYNNEKVVAEYVLIRFEDHRPDKDPSEEVLQSYFAKQKETFRTQELINAAYCYITPQDFFDQIDVPEAEVERFYQDNQDQYVQTEKVHARHILIRVPQDADEATTDAARKKIEKVLEEAKASDDFAGLAQKHSEDSTATKGGDLGFFEKGQMVEPFEQAAFALEPGEISPVIRTTFGFHIIKMEERQEAKEKGLDEVRDEILRELKFDQAMRMVRKKSMRLYAGIRKGKDFREAIDESKLSIRETGFFSRKDTRMQGVPVDLAQRFSEEAFAADEQGVGGVIKGERGYLLLKVEERKSPRIPSLEEVRAEVTQAVLKEMEKANAENKAKEMVQSLQNQVPFSESAEKAGAAETDVTEAFTREGAVINTEFTRTAFTLSAENPAAYLPTDNGFYVIYLKEKSPPLEESLQEARDEIKDQLIQKKKNNLFASWLDAVRKEVQVDVNQERMDRI
jgi:peptidyl-prolyl cis-trans isomerase D